MINAAKTHRKIDLVTTKQVKRLVNAFKKFVFANTLREVDVT